MDDNSIKPPSDSDSFYEDGSSPEEEEEQEQRNQMDVDVPKDEEHGTSEAHQHAREHIQQIKQHAQTARRVGGTAKKAANASKSAAQATKVAGSVGKQVLGTAVRSLAALLFDTPVGWIILLLILIFLIVFVIVSWPANEPHGGVTVKVTKTGPEQVPNPSSQDVTKADPSDIKYTIQVDYTNASQITVTDKIPDNTEYVSAGGPGNPTYDKASRTVTWNLTGSGGGSSSSGGAVSCSAPPAPANPSSAWSDWSCSGIASDKPIASGWYDNTVFGCGTGFTDPNDNCQFSCNGASGYDQALPECKGLSGPDCERKIKYFSADKDRYGCFAHLQVTNPKTGQSVIVIALDQGPACNGAELQHNGPIIDLGIDAAKAIGVGGNYELVHVQKVDSSVPLGPLTACK